MTATATAPAPDDLDAQLERGIIADAYDAYDQGEAEAWERYVAEPSPTEGHAYVSIERLLRRRRDRLIREARARC